MIPGAPPRRARVRARWLVAAAVLLTPAVADATVVRIGSRTIGEGYVIVAPGPEPRRQQLVDGQLEIVASMRLRQEFGDFLSAAGPDSGPVLESVDGRQIDLMFGYLQGRRIGGFFDFRAGRQFESSGLDWYAFDGG